MSFVNTKEPILAIRKMSEISSVDQWWACVAWPTDGEGGVEGVSLGIRVITGVIAANMPYSVGLMGQF